MNHSIKFFLPILVVAFTSSCLSILKGHRMPSSAWAANTEGGDSGLVKLASPHSVEETSDRLVNLIEAKGLNLFARVDHSVNAKNVGLELNPTQLLIFGNPKVGTPLMQCSITTAIDLPQKILVYQDNNEETQIAYNEPAYLQNRHDIEGCDEILDKVEGALQGITEAALE